MLESGCHSSRSPQSTTLPQSRFQKARLYLYVRSTNILESGAIFTELPSALAKILRGYAPLELRTILARRCFKNAHQTPSSAIYATPGQPAANNIHNVPSALTILVLKSSAYLIYKISFHVTPFSFVWNYNPFKWSIMPSYPLYLILLYDPGIGLRNEQNFSSESRTIWCIYTATCGHWAPGNYGITHRTMQ